MKMEENGETDFSSRETQPLILVSIQKETNLQAKANLGNNPLLSYHY